MKAGGTHPEVDPPTASAMSSSSELSSAHHPSFVTLASSARANRWSIVTIIVAMIVMSFAILYESGSRAGRSASDPGHATPGGLVTVDAAPRRDGGVRGSPAIVDIVTDQPLVGDGRQRALFVSLDAARNDVESVESRFVEGDLLLRSRAGIVDVSHAAVGETRLPAGMIGLKTVQAVRATFDFVVTLTDGRRSKPFRKELNIAPMLPTPPMITVIDPPDTVVAGRCFSLRLAVLEGDARLASIERTIVDEARLGTSRSRVIPIESASRLDRDTIDLPVDAIADRRPIRIALTPVDTLGRRGPVRTIVVAPTAPRRAAVVTASARTSCTRSTCGSIVMVRELDDVGSARGSRTPVTSATRRFEVLVRTDDRAIHAFREPRLLRTGTRARVFEGKLLALYTPPVARPMRREARFTPDSEPFVGP